jgi:hypothetical protein
LRESGPFRYRADVLAALSRHGVLPTDRIGPQRIRDFLRDLYKYELRLLRGRLLRNEFPRADYAARVDELRRRYPVLALRAEEWLE